MKFLGRARKFIQDLGSEPVDRVQYFHVTCTSGHRVRGERTEGYQALRCPACGEGVFVLPRSPLPEPVAPPGSRPKRRASVGQRGNWVNEGPPELTGPAEGEVEYGDGRARSAGDGGEAEIIWDDEADSSSAAMAPGMSPEDLAAAEIDEARRVREAAARQRDRRTGDSSDEEGAAPARRAPRPGSRDVTAAPTARGGQSAAAAGREARAAGPGRRPGAARTPIPAVIEHRPRRRSGPRVALIFSLLFTLMCGAVGWRAWMARREQLPRVIEKGRVEGLPALDAGEFDRAHQLLSAAKSAVDTLGGNVEDAEEIREAAREAAIFNDLCPETLEDMLAEAGRLEKDAWAFRFETLYKGHSCIFDTQIEATPEDGGGSYQLAYFVFPPGEASRFGEPGVARPDRFARIDLTGFKLFEDARPRKDTHVTFGARLESMVYDDEQGQWIIRLEARSGVFIQHRPALRVLGLPAPEAAEIPKEIAR